MTNRFICQSVYHWTKFCPHKVKKSDSTNGTDIALFSQEIHECYISKFVEESLNCTGLGNGCSEYVYTVLEDCLYSPTGEEFSWINKNKALTSSVFKDVNSLKSCKSVTFARRTANMDVRIRTDFIQNDSSSLLSCSFYRQRTSTSTKLPKNAFPKF